jgi:type IV secretory pathway VirJ component
VSRGDACRIAALAGAALLAAAPAPAADDGPEWRARVDALALPLTLVAATTTPPRAFLVFLSGDGGWAAVDEAVAGGLAERGITTIGWSSLRYFATAQAPGAVAKDLARVVLALEPARLPIYLGGYSFGAEVVPVVVAAHWPAAKRRRVRGMLLLAPSASATFRVNPLDWVGETTPDPAHRVDDAVRRLAPLPTLCVTGREDETCICPTLVGVQGVSVVRVPGNHHFENGISDVVDAAATRLFWNAPEAP